MENKRTYTLAIDFDGTLVCDEASKDIACGYRAIGNFRTNAKQVLQRLYDEGYYIIIWTARNGEGLVDMINFLEKEEVKYHNINDNNPINVSDDFNPYPKILADIYIDDRQLGGLPDDWETIYLQIKVQETWKEKLA